jgi:hypothetical protein
MSIAGTAKRMPIGISVVTDRIVDAKEGQVQHSNDP